MTLKSLKYTPEKTCGSEKPEPPLSLKNHYQNQKGDLGTNIVVEKKEHEDEEMPLTPPVKQKREIPVLAPDPINSFEDMRRER